MAGNPEQIPVPPERLKRQPDLRRDRPSELWRLHWEDDPSSSSEPANPGRWRFDAPHGEYPVTYANCERHHIFVEVYGDTDDHREIQPNQADRRISLASLDRPLKIVDLGDAETLACLRIDSRVYTTLDYPRTQLWSKALHDSLPDADGIRYPGRKAGREDNFCLFLSRCGNALSWNPIGTIASERPLVLAACKKFDITPRIYLEAPPGEAWPREN